MAKSTKAKGGNSRKHGRSRRKADARMKPISRLVRGLISAESYWKQTKVKK